ncbi:MAG: multiprotein-bridging factor 1 family protein [Nanoarchaeales archaeon]|nr:multiprotein-bridging factor 1 family protein [Nanoarchaeales archaeon]
MASCEMCGKDTTSLKTSVVAGSTMSLCTHCSIMGSMKQGEQVKSVGFKKFTHDDVDLEIPQNYAQIIQQGINKKHLTPHQVARAVNLKESTLSHYLKSQIKPDIVMARTFESFLEIKLVYEVTKKSIDVEDYKASSKDSSDDSSNKLANMFANLKK